jgi:uncharacterized membrane protein
MSSLACEIGFERFIGINFPPEVYEANALVESIITLPAKSLPSLVFGESLDLVSFQLRLGLIILLYGHSSNRNNG